MEAPYGYIGLSVLLLGSQAGFWQPWFSREEGTGSIGHYPLLTGEQKVTEKL